MRSIASMPAPSPVAAAPNVDATPPLAPKTCPRTPAAVVAIASVVVGAGADGDDRIRFAISSAATPNVAPVPRAVAALISLSVVALAPIEALRRRGGGRRTTAVVRVGADGGRLLGAGSCLMVFVGMLGSSCVRFESRG